MPIKWKPFRDLERSFPAPNMPAPGAPGQEEDNWVPFVPHSRAEEPAVDIYQDKKNLYVEVSLGGIKPENVEVSVEDNTLTIQGKSQEKKEVKERDYLKREIVKGSFHRVIRLPSEVKESKASAESTGGILKITIPKTDKPAAETKKIPIKIK